MNGLSPAVPPALDPAEVEHFLTYGFVRMDNCMDVSPGSIARRWVEESWARNGLSPDDRAGWPNEVIFMPHPEVAAVSDIAPRAVAAICQLCGGVDRIVPDTGWGNGFIANYGKGRDKEWIAPGAEAPGWHKDGDFFVHFLDSPEQALLLVVLFSDVHPRGGGTFVACDSVRPVARHLAAHPEGVLPNDFPFKDLIRECHDFREMTGSAGDVFLLHPFMLHASSYNHRPEARLMINPLARFRQPMRFDRRSDGTAYSPVEKAVLRALGVEHYDFKPTAPRKDVVPARIAMQQKLLEQERERLAALAARV